MGVGSAYADGDAHTWKFQYLQEFVPTPIEDCIEARRDCITVQEYNEKKYKEYTLGDVYKAYYINEDRMYMLEVSYDFGIARTINCASREPNKDD